MQRFKDVSASFGMDGVEFVNVGELCWSTSLCGGPYKLIKAGPCFLQRKMSMKCSYQTIKIWSMGKKIGILRKAIAVIDIMSSALSLVFQINETDRINILKMCDILFSQLCLRVPPATAPSFGDDVQHDRNLNLTSVNKKSDIDNHVLKQDSFHWVDIALGVAFGSKGRGNLPGRRPGTMFRELLDDTDSRVAYYSSAFLLKRMMMEKPEKYQNML
ncbi:hypothetical protein QL285_075477 [Trifolium repens]|nr:hypothetical protein QL285_075477 [Trifolium repens]